MNNCIIWGNSGAGFGNQIYNSSSTVVVRYSCYSVGAGDIYNYSTTFTPTSCINTDPGFADASSGDLRITGESTCLDAGNDSYNSQTYDIRGTGYSRKLNKADALSVGTIDMGAYEYKCGTDPLPVELTSFATSTNGAAVKLDWKTATEVNNYGFEIERRTIFSSAWAKIGFVAGNGTSNAPHSYSYADNTATSGKYVYRLKQVDNDGAFKYSGESEISLNTPAATALHQNYPNPFNPSTQISYDIAALSNVRLAVYDLLGREVAVLVNRQMEPGNYTAEFNGAGLASGLYFYRLDARQTTNAQAGSYTVTKKFTLMK